ncbi:substrate-binding domain-containing protein [Rhizobium sp. SYY.PMSO]|uniref:substrate-binding domain-containing protein n=1 Tax=Rhizobium sp. SYY.PMSO TaxID=3382192 RepID=UPI00398FF3C4
MNDQSKPLRKAQRVDLKTLAEQLELSQSTISRALSAHHSIPEKTRARVVAAAQKMGYSPNARARGLATGRTEAIGLVFPLERLQLAQTNFVDVLTGISDVVTRRNYSLLLTPFSDNEQEVLRKLATSKIVDGIIITRPLVDDPRISLLRDIGIPFVVHGRSDVDLPYSFIDIDNTAVFEKLANLLLDYGHERIGVFNSFLRFRYAHARRAGYCRALEARGRLPDPDMMFETPMTEQAGYDLSTLLLASDNPPTAFICGSVFLAQGVYRAVAERGLQVGRDISVVCHDDDLRGIRPADFDPPLTSTFRSVREAGEHLAEILIDLVEAGGDKEQTREIAEVDLILRSSVGHPRRLA